MTFAAGGVGEYVLDPRLRGSQCEVLTFLHRHAEAFPGLADSIQSVVGEERKTRRCAEEASMDRSYLEEKNEEVRSCGRFYYNYNTTAANSRLNTLQHNLIPSSDSVDPWKPYALIERLELPFAISEVTLTPTAALDDCSPLPFSVFIYYTT